MDPMIDEDDDEAMQELEIQIHAAADDLTTSRESIRSELTIKLMTTMQSDDCYRDGPQKPGDSNQIQTCNRSYLGTNQYDSRRSMGLMSKKEVLETDDDDIMQETMKDELEIKLASSHQ